MDIEFAVVIVLLLILPVGITTAFVRRKKRKAHYYADPKNDGPVEGSIDELLETDSNASPWRNDEKQRLNETMEMVERFDTMRGYSEQYVEDLKNEIRKSGIAAESIFLEGYPVGAFASLTTRMGIYELYVERAQLSRAKQVIEEFQSR